MIKIRKRKGVYEIVWYSQYGVEVVDEAETKKEAEYLASEYRMAFNAY